MTRKQFTFYRSFWESIESLQTTKEKAQAYRILCAYALDGIEPDESTMKPGVATVFRISRPVLDTARSRASRARSGL